MCLMPVKADTCFILSCLSESVSPEYGLGDKLLCITVNPPAKFPALC